MQKSNSAIYSKEHAQWQRIVEKFGKTVTDANIDKLVNAGEIPEDYLKSAAKLGITQTGFPPAYGGSRDRDDILHEVISYKVLGQFSSSALIANMQLSRFACEPLINEGTTPLKEEVLPDIVRGKTQACVALTEKHCGSDISGIKTTAACDGETYTLNGEKSIVTNGCNAKWALVSARTGSPGKNGISLFMVPLTTRGIKVFPLADTYLWKDSGSAKILFKNVHISKKYLIGQENEGFKAIVRALNYERLMISAAALGQAKYCLREAIKTSQIRESFGATLATRQVIRHKLSKMKQYVNALEATLDITAWNYSKGTIRAGDIALLKAQATKTLKICSEGALSIMGSQALIKKTRVARINKECVGMEFAAGTTEMMFEIAAKQMEL